MFYARIITVPGCNNDYTAEFEAFPSCLSRNEMLTISGGGEAIGAPIDRVEGFVISRQPFAVTEDDAADE